MKKFDILALGELNVDLLLNRIAGFPEVGKEIFAQDMTLTLGSSTAIFAANAATLGARVSFVGMIGKDSFGEVVKSMSLMGVKDIRPEIIREAKHVHVSSIFLQETLHKEIFEIVRMVKDCGATLSMDVQFDPEEKWEFDYKKILPLVDVFMPNEQELMAITRKATVEEAVDVILPYANVTVVKMGTRGSLVISGGKRFQMAAMLNKSVVDAIGAGDSFDAGFISAYVRGKDLAECQRLGNLAGAVNTTAAGGTGAFSSIEAVKEAAQRYFGQTIEL